MNRLNLIVIFVFVCLSGRCQTHKEKEDEIARAFKEWANNPVLTNQQLDLNIIHDLKDSGSMVNQLKKDIGSSILLILRQQAGKLSCGLETRNG